MFGYALTIRPLLASGMPFRRAGRTALAADTISITVMEIVDNLLLLAIPGAMAAGLLDALFWGSLAFALAVAFVVTLPVNRWLISRGQGPRGHPRAPRLTEAGAAGRQGRTPNA